MRSLGRLQPAAGICPPTKGSVSAKRVLHVEVGGEYGGSLRALQLYLAGADDSLKHDVLFYYPTPGSEPVRSLAGRTDTLFLQSPAPRRPSNGLGRSSRTSWLLPVWRTIWPFIHLAKQLPLALRLRKKIERGKYDLVHVNNTFWFQPATLLAAWLAGKPVVVHVRNAVDKTFFNRWLASLTDGIACVNPIQAAEISHFVRVPVRVCRDPIGKPEVNEHAAAALRSDLSGDGGILVGSIGRLHAQKGYEFFIRAAARVRERWKDISFVIAGDGEEREPLERLVRELGLDGKFHLLGFRHDAATVLASFDIFVCSSLWEGLPLSVLEAMQLGKPIISTPVGVEPEFLSPQSGVVIVPSADFEKLAEAIVVLARDSDLRIRMGTTVKQASYSFNDNSSIREFDRFLFETGTSPKVKTSSSVRA